MWEFYGLSGRVSAYEEGLLLMGRTVFEMIFKSFWKLLKNVFSKERTGTLIVTLEWIYCIHVSKNNSQLLYKKSYTFRLKVHSWEQMYKRKMANIYYFSFL